MLAMKFSEKLKRLCGQRRWGQNNLLEFVPNVTKSSMSNWFSGKYKPDLESALSIARALEVPLDWLADDEADFPSPTSGLTEDEKALLDLYHALELDKREALRRIATPPAEPRKEVESGREPRTFIGEATSHYTYDTTEARLARDRDKNRPKKSVEEGHGKKKPLSVDKGSTSAD